MATGVSAMAFGKLGLGKLMLRFPSPVTSGFLGTIGFFLVRTALQVLAVLVSGNKLASEALQVFAPYPQLLRNVRRPATALEQGAVRSTIAAAEAELGAAGRVVIRPSGTEPVVRVMVEGHDADQVEALVARLADSVAEAMAEAS